MTFRILGSQGMSGVAGSGAVSSGRFCFLYISQKLKLSDPPPENQPLLPKPGEKADSFHQAPSAQRRAALFCSPPI